MNADECAPSGRFPAVMVNNLDGKQVTEKNFYLVRALLEGYGEAIKQAGLVNITGEFAVMKYSITAFCDDGSDKQLVLTWCAACMGLAYRKFLIDSSAIKPGMPIVGFYENGYRCNGGTFFADLLMAKYKSSARAIIKSKWARNFAYKLTVPSISYAKTITRIVGWGPDGMPHAPLAKIAGIAHITGGGVWEKFGEILPDSVGATLNRMPVPTKILLDAQIESLQYPELRMSDWQAYKTFHGGCGMLIVCRTGSDAQRVNEEANKDRTVALDVVYTHDLEENHEKIEIISRFSEPGKILKYSEPE